MPLPKVLHINRSYANYGATEPFNVTLDSEIEAVIKYPHNIEGNRVLINEYLSYQIAEKINANIPKFGLCILDETVENPNNITIDSDNYGICFYSKFIKNTTAMFPSSFSLINDFEDVESIIILDHIIYNKDRHYGNLLAAPDGKIHVIDHSHVFKDQCIWTKYTFQNGIKNNDFLDKKIMECNQEMYEKLFLKAEITKSKLLNVVKLANDNLDKDTINLFFRNIPREWLNTNFKDDILSIEELNALQEYINFRISKLEQIVDMICKERGLS